MPSLMVGATGAAGGPILAMLDMVGYLLNRSSSADIGALPAKLY